MCYFRNLVAKSDKKQKTKNGMNKTQVAIHQNVSKTLHKTRFNDSSRKTMHFCLKWGCPFRINFYSLSALSRKKKTCAAVKWKQHANHFVRHMNRNRIRPILHSAHWYLPKLNHKKNRPFLILTSNFVQKEPQTEITGLLVAISSTSIYHVIK